MDLVPKIVVNCKAYREGVGKGAVRLARLALRVQRSSGVRFAFAVQPQDIFAVERTGIWAFAQHVDPFAYGAFTGSILSDGVRFAGAVGTLLNHSERRLSLGVLQKSINAAKCAGLVVVACAKTPAEARRVALLRPDAVAVEPPELIGGKISVSQAKPDVIEQTTKHVRLPVLCGAGVHSAEDVRRALELGARGVLVSSAVVKAKNPLKVMKDLADGFKSL